MVTSSISETAVLPDSILLNTLSQDQDPAIVANVANSLQDYQEKRVQQEVEQERVEEEQRAQEIMRQEAQRHAQDMLICVYISVSM